MQTCYIQSPIGTVKISGDQEGVSSIMIINQNPVFVPIPEVLREAVTQLEQYFKGSRKEFNFKINPQGTDFQKKIWQKLLEIPYGTTCSYMDLSKKIGNIKAIRAVAAANGKNQIWIAIPCHRIIGSGGSMTGYAGGVWRKKWLIAHENPLWQKNCFKNNS